MERIKIFEDLIKEVYGIDIPVFPIRARENLKGIFRRDKKGCWIGINVEHDFTCNEEIESVIIHEARHAWQYKMGVMEVIESKSYLVDSNFMEYYNSPLEVDARKASKRFADGCKNLCKSSSELDDALIEVGAHSIRAKIFKIEEFKATCSNCGSKIGIEQLIAGDKGDPLCFNCYLDETFK